MLNEFGNGEGRKLVRVSGLVAVRRLQADGNTLPHIGTFMQ
jgi:hypothetical protein